MQRLNIEVKNATPFLSWRIASIVFVGILFAGTILSFHFIYTTVYQTLDDANSIIVLNSNARLATFNEQAYAKAHDLVTLKKTPVVIPKSLRNVFTPVNAPTSSKR